MSTNTEQLLQAQITALQAQLGTSGTTTPVGLSIEDIKQAVKATIAEEVAALKVVEQVPPKPIENMSLLHSIGLGLTEEEQLWLSASERLQGLEKNLPLFFQTDDGKLAVQSFILFYRGIFDGTTN